jgi:hypothetical protein
MSVGNIYVHEYDQIGRYHTVLQSCTVVWVCWPVTSFKLIFTIILVQEWNDKAIEASSFLGSKKKNLTE